MAANTVSVSPLFSRYFAGTLISSLIDQVESTVPQTPKTPSPEHDKAFTRAWYEGMEQEAKRSTSALRSFECASIELDRSRENNRENDLEFARR
jgi:hypothetical protein